MLLRGLRPRVLSGAAFYLVSGMWTDHSAPPNYLRNFASWTFAFFPGFAALLWRRRAETCHRTAPDGHRGFAWGLDLLASATD